MVKFDLTKPFFFEDLFLKIKDEIQIDFLELLVSEINAELFDWVEFHALKSKDIEKTDFKSVVLEF